MLTVMDGALMQVPVHDIFSPAPFYIWYGCRCLRKQHKSSPIPSPSEGPQTTLRTMESIVDDATLWSRDVSDLTSMRVIAVRLSGTAMWAVGAGSVSGKNVIYTAAQD